MMSSHLSSIIMSGLICSDDHAGDRGLLPGLLPVSFHPSVLVVVSHYDELQSFMVLFSIILLPFNKNSVA